LSLSPAILHSTNDPFSFFSPAFLITLSHHPRISSAWTLGTVLAMMVAPPLSPDSPSAPSSGYASNAAQSLASAVLLPSSGTAAGIHARVLDDLLYAITSLTMDASAVMSVEARMLAALGKVDLKT
jgi:hypothetical protein